MKTYRTIEDRTTRDTLIVENLKLVRHALGRILVDLPSDIDRENLESAGVLGLVEAARNFNPERGVPFPVFAYARIRGAILDELRRNCPLPQQVLQMWAVIRAASSRLTPPVTPEDLATETGLSIEDVENCLLDVRMSRFELCENFDGISMSTGEDENTANLERAEQRQLLADAIERLPETMRLAVTLYYLENLRMREIGELLGLSESRISRLLAAAELRLRTLVQTPSRDQERCA